MSEEELYQKVMEYYSQNKNQEVSVLLESALSTYGVSRNYWFFRGVTEFNEQKFYEAIASLTKASILSPEDTRVHYNLGVSCVKVELYADAMGWFKKVLNAIPEHIPSLIMISAIFDITGNPSSGEKTCKFILKLDPDNVSAYNNLGNSSKNSGKPHEAVEAYHEALKRNSSVDSVRSNLLFALNYAATDPVGLRIDHEAFASYWDSPKFTVSAAKNEDGKIHIGFASPDFCSHSVSYFLTGLFTHIDRSKFTITCYANVEHPDVKTAWFQKQSDNWIDTLLFSKEQLAEKINGDKIDILIDLAGHTGGSSLPSFGLTPAPIQMTWLGYPSTTGMKTVEYRITDEIADPIGCESHYTEKLVRLPYFLNYTPSDILPPCDFSASQNRTTPLFGSFNNIAKLSPETIRLWGMVLDAIPDAQLLIKHKYFNDPGIQKLFLDRFKEAGVNSDQLIFKAFNFTDRGHLEEYHNIDIALDPWPYNGTTTTFEALVMGVPTLTLTGPVHASRVGTDIMKGMGLAQFTATSPLEFTQRAIELTQDRPKLMELKSSLRERFFASPFADSKRFTNSFQDALTNLWESHCAISD